MIISSSLKKCSKGENVANTSAFFVEGLGDIDSKRGIACLGLVRPGNLSQIRYAEGSELRIQRFLEQRK